MSERAFLERLRARVPAVPQSGVVNGIGDDCAVWRQSGSDDVLATTDVMIEGVHFLREYPAASVGHKALARSISDIAAMGGEPRFCLVSLVLSDWPNDGWVDEFYDGLLALAARYGVALAGGDVARGSQTMTDVIVCGTVPKGGAMLRSGARPLDRICVTGALGGAALGLRTQNGEARDRHLTPEPRVAEGTALRRSGAVSACMDLSDGLSMDLARLCESSAVGAELQSQSIPVFPGASLEDALHGGDDYELLFTADPRASGQFTEIGWITAEPGVRLDGVPLPALGYDHLRND